MSEAAKYCMVYVTTPDEREAFKLAENAVRYKLAACANVGGKVSSLYWWNGSIEQGDEYTLILKTTIEKYAELEQMIKKEHSFDNPCIIMLEIKQGSKDFLNWISDSTK